MKNLHIFLNSLKMATLHKFTTVQLPYNKNWKKLITILYCEGYIQNFVIKNNTLFIYLRYYNSVNCIRKIVLYFNTSNLFIKKKKLWLFNRQQGTLVLSTIYGLQTHVDCLKKNLGGKLLFFIS